jgi:hypothetical protein
MVMMTVMAAMMGRGVGRNHRTNQNDKCDGGKNERA